MSLLESKVVWSKGRWERRDYPTIMSGRVVRYTIGYSTSYSYPEINASRDAVCISGLSFNDEENRVAVLDIIERAWKQHLHLARARDNDPLPEIEVDI